jgi:2-methylaconitate cis-trans-isomerase PrpF
MVGYGALRALSHPIDYLFGQVRSTSPFVDWSGNCGNLTAAVGPFAISAAWWTEPRAA